MATLKAGRHIVFTTGQASRLSDQSMIVKDIDITALLTNTGLIYVGDDKVGAAVGNEAGFPPLKADATLTFEDVDLRDIWIDATVSGEGIHWGAVVV